MWENVHAVWGDCAGRRIGDKLPSVTVAQEEDVFVNVSVQNCTAIELYNTKALVLSGDPHTFVKFRITPDDSFLFSWASLIAVIVPFTV